MRRMLLVARVGMSIAQAISIDLKNKRSKLY